MRFASGIYFTGFLRFYGIIFPLFDPRRYNTLNMMAHECNFGFVFIRCDDPVFDGQLVHIKPLKPEPALYNTGKYLIKIPQLGLRYYLEGWTKNLLAWVKHFYIPDLPIGYGAKIPGIGITRMLIPMITRSGM